MKCRACNCEMTLYEYEDSPGNFIYVYKCRTCKRQEVAPYAGLELEVDE